MNLQEIIKEVDKIDGWFLPSQMTFLYPYVKSLEPYSLIVEIGTYRGRSAHFLSLSSPDISRIITIDPCNHPWGREYDKAGFKLVNEPIDKRVLENKKVTQWVMTSKEAEHQFHLLQLEMIPHPVEIDFLFIDGLHEVCREDLKLWLPWVKHNGLVAFHDYDNEHPEVKLVVDEYCKDGKLEIVEVGPWMCICKNLLNNPNEKNK